MNDLISRQMLLEYIHGEPIGRLLCDKYNLDGLIRQLPSAQPERKKGKWIEAYDPFNRISGRCSVCGWEAHLYEDDVVGMNYCPNCGADMRGEEDG